MWNHARKLNEKAQMADFSYSHDPRLHHFENVRVVPEICQNLILNLIAGLTSFKTSCPWSLRNLFTVFASNSFSPLNRLFMWIITFNLSISIKHLLFQILICKSLITFPILKSRLESTTCNIWKFVILKIVNFEWIKLKICLRRYFFFSLPAFLLHSQRVQCWRTLQQWRLASSW